MAKPLIALTLSFATLTAQAGPCLPLSGKVRLEPDPDCHIAELYPGPSYLGGAFCYKVKVGGPLPGSGYAGFTAEATDHLLTGTTTPAGTPATLHEQDLDDSLGHLGLGGTRLLFTARTVLDLAGGRIFTADSGVVSGDDSAEMLRVVRAEGLFEGYSGTLFSTGQALTRWAEFHGRLCLSPQGGAPAPQDGAPDPSRPPGISPMPGRVGMPIRFPGPAGMT